MVLSGRRASFPGAGPTLAPEAAFEAVTRAQRSAELFRARYCPFSSSKVTDTCAQASPPHSATGAPADARPCAAECAENVSAVDAASAASRLLPRAPGLFIVSLPPWRFCRLAQPGR